MDLLQRIRSKSREQWQAWVTDLWVKFRTQVQENGEIALIGGLAAGILVVLFFRLIIGVAIFVVLGAFIVWQLAYPESEQKDPKNGHSP